MQSKLINLYSNKNHIRLSLTLLFNTSCSGNLETYTNFYHHSFLDHLVFATVVYTEPLKTLNLTYSKTDISISAIICIEKKSYIGRTINMYWSNVCNLIWIYYTDKNNFYIIYNYKKLQILVLMNKLQTITYVKSTIILSTSINNCTIYTKAKYKYYKK